MNLRLMGQMKGFGIGILKAIKSSSQEGGRRLWAIKPMKISTL